MVLFSRKQSGDSSRRQLKNTTGRTNAKDIDQRYAFRRNRTLIGSASSKVVASTSESSAQLKSNRVQTHELVRHRRRIGLILAAVLICTSILFGLLAQFTAGVATKAQDISIRLDDVYEKSIQSYLSRHPAERLRFLLDVHALGAYLQSVTPEVESVAIGESSGFGKSTMILTMRRPIAGWRINDVQQYVDAKGVAYTRNYFATPGVQIVDNSGVQVVAGQAITSNRFLGFVGRVVGLAREQGYITRQVIIPSGSSRQVDLRLDGISYPVKFSVDRAAGEQVEDMIRAHKWLSSRGMSVEYLDVRVSGKAFYR